MIKGTFIKEIEVIDPDSKAPVQISIYKLETGGMMGVDSSFLDTCLPVYSAFDKNKEIDLD